MKLLNTIQLKWLNLFFLILFGFACSCSNPPRPSNATAIDRAGGKKLSQEEMRGLSRAVGQTVYVPVYSHIYHREDMEFDLTTTLSIRNTDFNNSIVIYTVKYFDTTGKLVRDYADTPLILPAMATLDYIVGERDRTGGSGANFIVEWFAEKDVSEPIIESVMIGTSGQQGISFLSVGKVIK
ncbi:MAG TPA: DUF3124 domain-containing protein [bacterium]|nr:DUF3124 domain-containing protein [bacterium]